MCYVINKDCLSRRLRFRIFILSYDTHNKNLNFLSEGSVNISFYYPFFHNEPPEYFEHFETSRNANDKFRKTILLGGPGSATNFLSFDIFMKYIFWNVFRNILTGLQHCAMILQDILHNCLLNLGIAQCNGRRFLAKCALIQKCPQELFSLSLGIRLTNCIQGYGKF